MDLNLFHYSIQVLDAAEKLKKIHPYLNLKEALEVVEIGVEHAKADMLQKIYHEGLEVYTKTEVPLIMCESEIKVDLSGRRMLEKPEKVVTDEPTTNYGTVLNFARVKDREVVLSYADGEEDANLCEYIAKLATEKGCSCTADDVRDGDSCSCESECDCEVSILNIVAIQAAELRERLKYYEDKEEAEQQGDCEARR